MGKKKPEKDIFKLIASGRFAPCLTDDCENVSSHISGFCIDCRTYVCKKCKRKFYLEGYAPEPLRTKLCWRCVRWKVNQELAAEKDE